MYFPHARKEEAIQGEVHNRESERYILGKNVFYY